MIGRWQISGLSQQKFCEGERIPFNRFYYWYKKFRDRSREPSGGFVQLKTEKESAAPVKPGAEVFFANGTRVVLHGEVNMDQLRKLAG